MRSDWFILTVVCGGFVTEFQFIGFEQFSVRRQLSAHCETVLYFLLCATLKAFILNFYNTWWGWEESLCTFAVLHCPALNATDPNAMEPLACLATLRHCAEWVCAKVDTKLWAYLMGHESWRGRRQSRLLEALYRVTPRRVTPFRKEYFVHVTWMNQDVFSGPQ